MNIPFISKPDPLEEQLVSDLADYLMDYNIKPELAFRMSREFWKKNKDKLKEALRL